MNIILAVFAIIIAFAKPPTFADKFATFDQKLYDYAVAIGTNGDTAATRAAMLSAANDLAGYNVAQELGKLPPIQQYCRWACAGQFFFYCINWAPNNYEYQLCINEYNTCVRNCGYIPF